MTNRMQRNHDPDWAIRMRAFSVVERLAVSTGGRIPWAEIARGFLYEGDQVQLASKAHGIFKPRQMSAALSIRTAKPRTGRPSWYRDQSADLDIDTGLLSYDLVRDPHHHTNASLKRAYERRVPLIYFRALEPARYEAIWPVWIEYFMDDQGRVLLSAVEPKSKEPQFRPGGAGTNWHGYPGSILLTADDQTPQSPSLVQQQNQISLRLSLRFQQFAVVEAPGRRSYQIRR